MTRGITVALTVKEIRQAGLDKIPCTEVGGDVALS